MAGKEMIDSFDELQSLRYEMLTKGVHATVKWLATPQEQRIGDSLDDPEFIAAERMYVDARSRLASPGEFADA